MQASTFGMFSRNALRTSSLSVTHNGGEPLLLPFAERDGSWRHAQLPYRYDDRFWLCWAERHTPSLPNSISFDEARRICRDLSHKHWQYGIQEEAPLWRVRYRARGSDVAQHIRPCSASLQERKVLQWRQPDPSALLDVERANEIATEFDGEWGSVRVERSGAEGWGIAIFLRDRESLEGSESDEAGTGRQTGNVETPRDEPSWRWWLTSEREQAEAMALLRRNKKPWPPQIAND